jgi:hemerythrin-like domain-containing protein
MSSVTKPRDSTLYTYMVRSHADLRSALEQLLAAMERGTPDVPKRWAELEHGLLAHMEAEERFVLPAFARVDRGEALALLREHGELREHVLDLGVAIDLHAVTYARSREFAEALRRHAGREENLMYRWADASLDRGCVASIEARLRSSFER